MSLSSHIRHFFLFIIILLGSACSGSAVGTSTGNPITPKSLAFPQELAVASPFETVEASSGSSLTQGLRAETSSAFATAYDDALVKINGILDGTDASDCVFDPTLFFTADENASCYGPAVDYEGHPDATGEPPPAPQASGELPVGDVGLWVATDTETGNACAAAQLNSRMQALGDRTVGSLMGAASLLCVTTANDLELPENNSLDLTDEMNNLGTSGVNFDSALLAHTDASGSDVWSYTLQMNVTSDGNTFPVTITLEHSPGASTSVYEGRLSYRMEEERNAGNCPEETLTYNGSVQYGRTSETDLKVQARGGQFCGADVDGTTDGLVDPSKKYDAVSRPDGWANTFSIFTANFAPSDLAGNYSFAWQAGPMDNSTRVLNAILTGAADGETGAAFYGFGEDIEESDGAIGGFYCNWAGPQGAAFGEGVFQAKTQYQSMVFNASTGIFDIDESNITYAPTNSCDYDGAGSFRFDSNGDGTIDTNAATAIADDLIGLVDGNGDGIFDAVEESGFNLPEAP